MFAGFVFLILLSQLSAHVLGQAIIAYQPNGNEELSRVRYVSVVLAASAAGLGVVFGSAVLVITRDKLRTEIDVYQAAGLPLGSALKSMVGYHPVRPLLWLAGSTVVAASADLVFGLAAAIPLALAVCFGALLLGWVVLLTVFSFRQRVLRVGGRGRVG